MTALYDLAGEYREAADRLHDLDMDEQTITDTLEGLSGELTTKATNVAFVVRNLESLADQIKQAEQAMEKRRKALEHRADAVRRYLMDNMELAGITKIESPYFVLSVRENPPAVVIDDAGLIPCELYVYPVAPEPYPDKKAISAKLKAGEQVDGCHLSRGKRLDIR